MHKPRTFKDMVKESQPAHRRAEKRSEVDMLRDELYHAQQALNALNKELLADRRARADEREAVCNIVGEILTNDEISDLDDIKTPVISAAAIKKIGALKSQLAKYEEIIASMPELLEYNELLRVENEYLRQGG